MLQVSLTWCCFGHLYSFSQLSAWHFKFPTTAFEYFGYLGHWPLIWPTSFWRSSTTSPTQKLLFPFCHLLSVCRDWKKLLSSEWPKLICDVSNTMPSLTTILTWSPEIHWCWHNYLGLHGQYFWWWKRDITCEIADGLLGKRSWIQNTFCFSSQC